MLVVLCNAGTLSGANLNQTADLELTSIGRPSPSRMVLPAPRSCFFPIENISKHNATAAWRRRVLRLRATESDCLKPKGGLSYAKLEGSNVTPCRRCTRASLGLETKHRGQPKTKRRAPRFASQCYPLWARPTGSVRHATELRRRLVGLGMPAAGCNCPRG
jgi:hypothetical protein